MRSMTGFAAEQGERGEGRWRWEFRSVNARGLEVRFRTPSGCEDRERDWRERVAAAFSRGTIAVSLSIDEEKRAVSPLLDITALDAAISAARAVEARARAVGLETRPISIEGLLAVRGVLEPDRERQSDAEKAAREAARQPLMADVETGFARGLAALLASREEEGGRLKALLSARLNEISELAASARQAAAARQARAPEALKEKVQALLDSEASIDPSRLAQEVALLAVKTDVTEELERLEAHIAAARSLLERAPPVGRKIDFLTQELNREANTLCSKSQDQALTEFGLALKVAIDQLREQSANVE